MGGPGPRIHETLAQVRSWKPMTLSRRAFEGRLRNIALGRLELVTWVKSFRNCNGGSDHGNIRRLFTCASDSSCIWLRDATVCAHAVCFQQEFWSSTCEGGARLHKYLLQSLSPRHFSHHPLPTLAHIISTNHTRHIFTADIAATFEQHLHSTWSPPILSYAITNRAKTLFTHEVSRQTIPAPGGILFDEPGALHKQFHVMGYRTCS